jgi:hypothetical protein
MYKMPIATAVKMQNASVMMLLMRLTQDVL